MFKIYSTPPYMPVRPLRFDDYALLPCGQACDELRMKLLKYHRRKGASCLERTMTNALTPTNFSTWFSTRTFFCP
jgi:hypothetical protein